MARFVVKKRFRFWLQNLDKTRQKMFKKNSKTV